MVQAEIGVIGGSGLYEMEGITNSQFVKIDTPFGSPSDEYFIGTLEDRKVAFLPRHGRGHYIMPSELNFRANIYGMKKLGVKWIISVSAVGSLKEEYAPTHIVLPHQFYDKTRFRKDTFFGDGIVAHISLADPVCIVLSELLYKCAKKAGATVHNGGTYCCMEGPAFSTKAESEIHRELGFDVIGMTNVQEAKLAREAELCYATMAMVTDYDVWHEEEEHVSVEQIVAVLQQNARTAQEIVRLAVSRIPAEQNCGCASALATAIITSPDKMPPSAKKKLKLIVGKYVK
jgi:5'-methylthioadenosine phosphorylase